MKDIVNFKLQTFLFAFALLMHLVATFVEASHPLFGTFVALLETLGWLCILLTWVFALITGIQQWGPKLWRDVSTHGRKRWAMGWRYVSTHGRIKKTRKTNDPCVSGEQLKQLKHNIDRLGLALHGMTPEMESARRTSFHTRGAAVPPLILPPQNASLYAEFTSLIRFLTHVGFPNLESVRLQQKDLAFAQQWGSELEVRLQHVQADSIYQMQTMLWLLDTSVKTFERIGSTYPQAAQHDAGYQRIAGALKLLTKMARKSRPEDMISSLTALLQDMESLRTQLKQAAA